MDEKKGSEQSGQGFARVTFSTGIVAGMLTLELLQQGIPFRLSTLSVEDERFSVDVPGPLGAEVTKLLQRMTEVLTGSKVVVSGLENDPFAVPPKGMVN